MSFARRPSITPIPDLPSLYETYQLRIEGYVKLYCKPRPDWMPDGLYRWLMSQVVLYEELPKWVSGE